MKEIELSSQEGLFIWIPLADVSEAVRYGLEDLSRTASPTLRIDSGRAASTRKTTLSHYDVSMSFESRY